MKKLRTRRAELLLREQGAVVREWGHRTPVALVYPHEYAVGMSNLGFQTIYHLINSHPDLTCERFFLPGPEEVAAAGGRATPLLSVESQRPLTDFAIVAFSLSFEPDYLGVLQALSLGRLPLLAAQRDERFPLVVAGGVAVMLNPEPLAPFIDAFFIGEAETSGAEFFALLAEVRGQERFTALRTVAQRLPGVYVPAAYQPEYHPDGTLRAFLPAPGFPPVVQAPHPRNLDEYPVHSHFLAPGAEFSQMFLIELNRGCGRGCRFCAAGFIYRPLRQRSLAALAKSLQQGLASGAKIGLVGTAVSDHPDLMAILQHLTEHQAPLGLSSLRADETTPQLCQLLKQGGVKSVALAPEAGSERLRRVINKNLSKEELEQAVLAVQAAGIPHLRLYFLLGLPTESNDDVTEIVKLTKHLQHIAVKAGAGKPALASITLSLNSFVPKPFTPFQWVPFAGVAELKERIKRVKRGLQGEARLRVHADLPKWAYYQALLSRGDRRVADILSRVHQTDGDWLRACRESPINPDFFVMRLRQREELFPWDFIDHGVTKDYLWEEYQKALAGQQTPPCPVRPCQRCGVCQADTAA